MTLRTAAVALAATAIFVLPASATAGKGSKAPVREFTGTVASVKGKSFKLRRSGRATVTVEVARKTRVAKGAKPLKGRKLVVKARRDKKVWVARSVKLVPVVADGNRDDVFDDGESLEDDPIPAEDNGEADDPGLDLDDALGDLVGDGGDGDPGE